MSYIIIEEEVQTETQHRQKREQHSGFRLVAFLRTGTALTSASAICPVVAHSAMAMCSTRALARTLIAMACAQSCKWKNSGGKMLYIVVIYLSASS